MDISWNSRVHSSVRFARGVRNMSSSKRIQELLEGPILVSTNGLILVLLERTWSWMRMRCRHYNFGKNLFGWIL